MNFPECNVVEKDGRIYLPTAYTGFKSESWHLNPMQELVVPHIYSTNNMVVAAPTASGKSTVLMMAGTPALAVGGSVLYVAPYKALADEKLDDVQRKGHPWEKIPKLVVSGDYPWTPTQIKKASRARFISVTPESLISVLRKSDPQKTKWLSRVRVIVFDEIHLVTDASRGATMETMIMDVALRLPKARLIGLSATVSNPEDLQEWFTRLNERETDLIQSTYRPVPIVRHFYEYEGFCDSQSMPDRQQLAIELGLQFHEANEAYMIAVWNKKFGYSIQDDLRENHNLSVPFHNADVPKETRKNIESDYRTRIFPGLIATSTVFVGVNLPPRHLILTATHVGIDNEIPVHELLQAEGRSGRPEYDTEAHAHYLIHAGYREELEAKLLQGCHVESNFHKPALVAQHFLGALYTNALGCYDSFMEWFTWTLRYVQLPEENVDSEANDLLTTIISDMVRLGMIRPIENILEDEFELTQLGKIAAQTMADPYVLYTLIQNFRKLSLESRVTELDVALAWTSYVEDFAGQSVPKYILHTMGSTILSRCPSITKAATVALYLGMTRDNVPRELQGLLYRIQKQHITRYAGILGRVMAETGSLRTLQTETYVRSVKSAARGELLADCMNDTPYAQDKHLLRLFGFGLITSGDIRKNRELAESVFSRDRVNEILRKR